jgi:hypothetical protein
LVAADKVKDDPPVNVAGGFTCCYLEIGKVNLSHSAEGLLIIRLANYIAKGNCRQIKSRCSGGL